MGIFESEMQNMVETQAMEYQKLIDKQFPGAKLSEFSIYDKVGPGHDDCAKVAEVRVNWQKK
ncbi:MAG: hypothetical protein ACD_58C00330G0006 [uncultured bacterium]|nr:MAG: hypothetical protein ACD_58C00330G0006 [uncultured bacterium]